VTTARKNISGRLIYLDVLRAVAILLVLGHHTPTELKRDDFGFWLFNLWRRGGWAGVDLFFVLSGFLIGSILLLEVAETGTLDAKRFWIRRVFKIWPCYFVFLLVNSVHRLIRFPGGFAQRAQDLIIATWPNWLHIQNYTGYWGSPFGHTWSLAVEEHFYLILPIILEWILVRRPMKLTIVFPRILIAVILLCPLVRLVTAVLYPDFNNFWIHQAPTHLRVDSLTSGVLLAWFVVRAPHKLEWLRAWSGVLFVVGLLTFLPAFIIPRESFFMLTLGFSLEAFGAACLVCWAWMESNNASKYPPPRLLRSLTQCLAYVGLFSYSIYLWHEPYGRAVALRVYGVHGSHYDYAITMLVFIIGAVVLGIVSYKLIESPFLSLRNAWFPTLKRDGSRHQRSQRVAHLAGPTAQAASRGGL
jgi:peptidoglycan/LPS O-acetylase OafA/YrhL